MSEKRSEFADLFAYQNGAATPASVTVVRDFSKPMAETYRLSVWIGDRLFEATSFDAFQALEYIRQQFEPAGWLLGIKGCSLRTRMSGGLRDSRDGLDMYEPSLMTSAGLPETVSTFAAAPLEDLATVDAQSAAWLNDPSGR